MVVVVGDVVVVVVLGAVVVDVTASVVVVDGSSETCSSWPHPTNTESTAKVAAKKRLRDVPIYRPATIQPSRDVSRLESPEPQL